VAHRTTIAAKKAKTATATSLSSQWQEDGRRRSSARTSQISYSSNPTLQLSSKQVQQNKGSAPAKLAASTTANKKSESTDVSSSSIKHQGAGIRGNNSSSTVNNTTGQGRRPRMSSMVSDDEEDVSNQPSLLTTVPGSDSRIEGYSSTHNTGEQRQENRGRFFDLTGSDEDEDRVPVPSSSTTQNVPSSEASEGIKRRKTVPSSGVRSSSSGSRIQGHSSTHNTGEQGQENRGRVIDLTDSDENEDRVSAPSSSPTQDENWIFAPSSSSATLGADFSRVSSTLSASRAPHASAEVASSSKPLLLSSASSLPRTLAVLRPTIWVDNGSFLRKFHPDPHSEPPLEAIATTIGAVSIISACRGLSNEPDFCIQFPNEKALRIFNESHPEFGTNPPPSSRAPRL
jgi:hypothetical protein